MPELLEALSQRRARRAFDLRPVPAELQELLWRAVSVAPSHGNSQPTRILLAESDAARTALVAALSEGNRQWAPAAPLLFAIGVMSTHDAVQTGSDGSTRELWAFHAGIATANLLAQATALGLTAHPMAGFDEPAVRAAFGAPPELHLLAVVAAGYPGEAAALPDDLAARENRPQERLPLTHVVAHDRWDPDMALSPRDLRQREQGSR